ncbi:unnamed protein product [Rotaria magnacalcarata]|uniref:Uncharacterized protein n=1 Tax=Rotaria magnacalcarata TaxID=392030 RepID=A0A814MSK9_9BILA|nr:unnamed protein product [Rotaria magnacalcarata]CAF1235307.1 unnamed protein product [Rotaria magnacalcarata]CAF2044913.1 unnamed protein product [Rotaria magnacalcarata]CAF4419934.1 unnamed protein product [Rotaria magnacalcarata]CAF4717792.1 unnamed protein product [Rotaria magnacalcarata]
MGRFIFILIILIIGRTNGLRQRRQANGCGAGYFNIDQSLTDAGESVIIPCCNQHDVCYDKCGRTQKQCDEAFRSCLNSACAALKGNGFQWWIDFRRAACELDGRTLYTIVNAVGSFAYKAAQRAHGC